MERETRGGKAPRPAGAGRPDRPARAGTAAGRGGRPNRLDRVGPARSGQAGPPRTPRKRRVSRAEREARRQRQLYLGMAVVGVIVVLILAIGWTRTAIVIPNQVLAQVNGHEIKRKDYWKVRILELINQSGQYQQLANFYQADQQQQYLQLAAQANSDAGKVWGSSGAPNDSTLQRMIDDQVYLDSLGQVGQTLSDQDVQDYIDSQFEPQNSPIFTPTPTPTLIPGRAAWATGTAEAMAATALATAGLPATPLPVGSPVTGASPAAGATPVAPTAPASPALVDAAAALATPVPASSPDGSPMASSAAGIGRPVASPVGSPGASPVGSPGASPAASPGVMPTSTPAPTPNQAQARSTARAQYKVYRSAVFGRAHMSQDDYIRLVARPAVARQKVTTVLQSQVGQSAEQVHAAQILVATEDLARSLKQQIDGGANFEDLAKTQSSDSQTAGNGGDLGWFTRGEIKPPAVADAAFALQPNQVSDPISTPSGWAIIKVYAHEPDRPLTDAQYQKAKQDAVTNWLEARRAEARISSDLKPTPTPAPGSQTFSPPPNAPPAPTPTLAPAASPVGSPVASPVASPVGSPVASPAASPAAAPTA